MQHALYDAEQQPEDGRLKKVSLNKGCLMVIALDKF